MKSRGCLRPDHHSDRTNGRRHGRDSEDSKHQWKGSSKAKSSIVLLEAAPCQGVFCPTRPLNQRSRVILSVSREGMVPGQAQVSVSQLVEAGLLRPGQVLRFQGRSSVEAKLDSRGCVKFRSVSYGSPSAAAAAAARGVSTNGWIAWRVKYEGRWVALADLRRRFLEQSLGQSKSCPR